MRRTSKTFSPRLRQAGLTLVEVVAGLALISTLLAAVLIAQGRATRQAALANRRTEAVAAADTLLAGWWQDVDSFPRRASGRMEGEAGLSWRTTPIANAPLKAWGTSVVRLEVFDDRPARSPATPAPLATVEVVLNDERPADGRPGMPTRAETR